MELIHKQPVKWTHERIAVCDGGGGAAGHPQVFINTDKPEIAACGYCGLPFVRLQPSPRCCLPGRPCRGLLANVFLYLLGERAPPETPRIAPRDFISSLEWPPGRANVWTRCEVVYRGSAACRRIGRNRFVYIYSRLDVQSLFSDARASSIRALLWTRANEIPYYIPG